MLRKRWSTWRCGSDWFWLFVSFSLGTSTCKFFLGASPWIRSSLPPLKLFFIFQMITFVNSYPAKISIKMVDLACILMTREDDPIQARHKGIVRGVQQFQEADSEQSERSKRKGAFFTSEFGDSDEDPA